MKKIIVTFFIFLFSFLSIFSSGVIDSIDGFLYLAVARNIYYKGEPVAPEYKYDTRENIHLNVYKGKDGKTYSLTGLGYSLAMMPAVLLTDIVYKLYDIPPPVNFPLENDWLILLTASFTNVFFGAMLGTILLIYFGLLGLNKRSSILLSLISISATNLFPYTKHSMAHMMFIAFLMLSFLMFKLHSQSQKKVQLIIAGASFGVVCLTYNATFGLAAIPLITYYFLLNQPRKKLTYFKTTLLDIGLFIVGVLPLLAIYIWFENVRALDYYNGAVDIASVGFTYITYTLPLSVFIEGIYGQLFSPGRSIFLYSPLLMLPILFWHKIKKNFYPEAIIFVLYSIILICFYAKAYSIGSSEQGVAALWHGESSWGPRYLTPIIPFGMLVVAGIYKKVSRKAHIFVFYPLVGAGIFVQMLGVLMPYQTKFAGLEPNFFLNGTEYTSYAYSNLLPRYMPILAQSRNLFKLVKNFPQTFLTGPNDLRFIDGVDFPFYVGSERWRTIESSGYITFNNSMEVKKISLGLANHPLEQGSDSARVMVFLNGEKLLPDDIVVPISERKLLELNIPNSLKDSNNQLIIANRFVSKDGLVSSDSVFLDDPSKYQNKTVTPTKNTAQILGLYSFQINDIPQNLESITVPYVSGLGPKILGLKYNNWGGENKDPWKAWDIHTQTFERLPDFWWLRNLYYWDIPKAWILTAFFVNIVVLIWSGIKLRIYLRKT